MNAIKMGHVVRSLIHECWPATNGVHRERMVEGFLYMLRDNYLRLYNVEVISMPNAIEEMDDLRDLTMVNTSTEHADIKLPASLETLCLDGNKIEEFPCSIPIGISKISIAGNRLRNIPDLSKYRSLKSLDLRNNPIRYVQSLPPSMRKVEGAKYVWHTL